MSSREFHAICDALLGPFWGLAGGMGFRKVERETDGNDFLADEPVSFVDRGIGGPGGAHFVVVDGSVCRRGGVLETSVWSVGFITFLRAPEIQEVRSIAALIDPGLWPAVEVRFDSALLWRLRPGGNDRPEARAGILDLATLWSLHRERLGSGAGIVLPEDDLGAFDRLHDELLEAQTALRS
jgi:hypothetical protein